MRQTAAPKGGRWRRPGTGASAHERSTGRDTAYSNWASPGVFLDCRAALPAYVVQRLASTDPEGSYDGDTEPYEQANSYRPA